MPRVDVNFCKTERSSERGMWGGGAGTIDFISPDLLFQNASIGITETLRGCVCRGRVNGISMRGRRSTSAARLRCSEVITGCALTEGIRSVRAR